MGSKIKVFNDFDFILIIRTYMYKTFNNTQLRKKNVHAYTFFV